MLPKITTFEPTNTVAITGTLPGTASGNHVRCLGVAEEGAGAGYFGYLCNDGNWYLKQISGLGSNGVSVGAQLVSEPIPFSSGTPYQVALEFRAGTLTMTVLNEHTNSPVSMSVPRQTFAATTVGIGYENIDYNFALDPSGFYTSVGNFTYTAGTG